MDIYLVRYYDYDWEQGRTIGLFKTFTDVLAELSEEYYGRIDISSIEQPTLQKDASATIDDGEYGERIEIKLWEV